MRFVQFLGVVFILAIQPVPAHAQLEVFVQEVRSLGEAAARAEPARSNAIRAAASRLDAALAEWDRRVSALQTRVGRDLRRAPPQRASQLHVELGVAYRARGRLPDALHEFDAAARLQPSASDLQILRALTLDAAGRSEEADRAFVRAWTLDAPNPIKAYYVAQRPGVGAADRERARGFLRDTYAHVNARAGEAATPPFPALDVVPHDLSHPTADRLIASAAHLAGGTSAEAGNRVSDARREYQAALAGALAGRSVILVAIARLALVEGDATGAVAAFSRAVQLSPNDLNIRKEFAAAYAADGRTDEAFNELMAALLIDGRDAQAHAALGQLALDTGRPLEAVTAFTRALELLPDGYDIRYALATAYIRMGNTADAARQLEIFDRMRREALERRRREIQ